MTLDEARSVVDQFFLVGPKGNDRLAPTGEEYIVICSGGIKSDYDLTPALASTEALAVELWMRAVREYAAQFDRTTCTLYWRIVPEMDKAYFLSVDEDGKFEFEEELRKSFTRVTYRVYSRMLISDKPQIQPAKNVVDGDTEACVIQPDGQASTFA